MIDSNGFPNNYGPIHGECADKRREEFQESIKGMKPEDFIGKAVKLAFPCEGQREHMWVQVTCLAEDEGEELRGELDNDPVLIENLSYGDIIEFKMSEIEQVI